MGRTCIPLDDEGRAKEEVRSRDLDLVNTEAKRMLSRARWNAYPDSKHLHRCVRESAKNFYTECAKPEPLTECDCTEDSSEADSFRECLGEEEVQRFVDVIRRKLDEELSRYFGGSGELADEKSAEFFIVPVLINNGGEATSSFDSCATTSSSDFSSQVCEDTCSDTKCKTPSDRIPSSTSETSEPDVEPFRADYVGVSEEIAKWGEFLDLVERVLKERDRRLRDIRSRCVEKVVDGDYERMHRYGDLSIGEQQKKKKKKKRDDRFEELDRFRDVEIVFSALCRGLIRWRSCTTKRWDRIINFPHVVIHLPSMSYPCHLRCRARGEYRSLQNIQIGRLGWLVNENAQLVYVYPGKSNFETSCILRNFVRNARPDVSLSRLWIIENDDQCFCEDVEEEYRSGCESLFYTPSVYRRVRHLTAGRHGFIVPGVLSKTDILIACELKTAIIGPCLKFQERLLNKHYVMSLLTDARIHCPTFAGVRNFSDLCEKMSEMMRAEKMKRKSREMQWLVKVNCGFCGNQSALVRLDPRDGNREKEDLQKYLADVLPRKLTINKGAYENVEDFLLELERHGGVLTTCPERDYRTVSLGCFIEHDTAAVRLRTSADVLRTWDSEGSCSRSDLGYVIPQTSLPDDVIEDLLRRLSDLLLMEQHSGFFGVDLVVFEAENSDSQVLDYWVVDIDPYYTDLLSFDDWRRFCLNVPICASANRPSINTEDHRFVVCSGKLYVSGLSLMPINFFDDLCKKYTVAYSHEAKTGCMICPTNTEKTALLIFSFCRSRERALENLVRILKALRFESTKGKRSVTRKGNGEISNLVRVAEETTRASRRRADSKRRRVRRHPTVDKSPPVLERDRRSRFVGAPGQCSYRREVRQVARLRTVLPLVPAHVEGEERPARPEMKEAPREL